MKNKLPAVRTLLSRLPAHYSLLTLPYSSPDRDLLRGLSWPCPFTPLLTVLRRPLALGCFCSYPPQQGS